MEWDKVQTMTLDFLRDDGKHEATHLHDRTLREARDLADAVFRDGRGLYVQVDITTEDGYTETLSNLHVTGNGMGRI